MSKWIKFQDFDEVVIGGKKRNPTPKQKSKKPYYVNSNITPDGEVIKSGKITKEEGNKIAKARNELAYNRKDFAQKVQVTENLLTTIENGTALRDNIIMQKIYNFITKEKEKHK